MKIIWSIAVLTKFITKVTCRITDSDDITETLSSGFPDKVFSDCKSVQEGTPISKNYMSSYVYILIVLDELIMVI